MPRTALPSSRQDAGLPARAFVFCRFNQSYKIRPQVLWFLRDSEEGSDNLRREATKCGVAPERLIFAPRVGGDEHLARNKLSGLFLDTLPYNAHRPASDALRAGGTRW
jgi:protein O-GlcNAc transferase